ncbi:hypothetical protein CK203_117488 [Vitis vinifera]|uniref:Uncharacterized protein n=1 Tax=Vitis vinifera TaxID=29760 RepID=A0A438CRR0_VITVI|nr:hypothetical protein CK203_117488 [Vitis vinifera]
MAALLHFEEKVHTRLTRADTILYFSLGCYAMFGAYGFSCDPHSEPRAIVERASFLTNGIRYGSISIPQNFPSQGKSLHRLYHLYLLRPLQLLEPVPEAASSDAPPAVPPTSERPLLSLCRDQQTLILREIQQHLGLLPPAPPVVVPSTVAAEDPSYPPEEPTT